MHAFLISLLCLFSCIANAGDVSSADAQEHDFSKVNRLSWRIVKTLDHDKNRFTQGLVIHDHRLFESTGLYGRSALFETDLKTGKERKIAQLLPSLFGEGLTIWRDQLVMLTWREGIAQYFNLNGSATTQRRFDGEGWGITSDGSRLIMSNGTADLSFRDPQTFRENSRITVRAGGASIARLNELEFARQSLFANIWQTNQVVQINPENGDVIAWLDLGELKQRFVKPLGWNPIDHVLNGIAYDPASGHFYVTGKCWPKLFVLEIGPVDAPAAP